MNRVKDTIINTLLIKNNYSVTDDGMLVISVDDLHEVLNQFDNQLLVDIPVKGETMPQTLDNLQACWIRDQELLFEQNDEISKLKDKINTLQQKVNSFR